MFSGIVETTGTVVNLTWLHDCMQISVVPEIKFDDLQIGDSISVNGVCLTVTAFDAQQFRVEIVPETLRLTNLKLLTENTRVNLERSLKANARIGGHNVQGHVDTTGRIIQIEPDGAEALIATIAVKPAIAKYIVNKGYVSIDGMSITVIKADTENFTVTFIPHTQQTTIAHQYRTGTDVNIEVDIMGKYIEKLLGAYQECNPQ
jgi:riboflavin synthase